MRTSRLIAGAALLIVAALVGGTLIGSVLAAPRQGTTQTDGAGRAGPAAAYCDVFLDTFAGQLGVGRDAIGPAAQAGAAAAIDAAVADGAMSEERAAAAKERLGSADGDPCDLPGAFGGGLLRGGGPPPWAGGPPEHAGGGRGMGGLGGLVNPAAELFGVEPGQLFREIRGSSLQEVATEHGVDYGAVRSAILGALQTRLDEALAEGLPQERADAALERVQSWLDEGGPATGAPGPGLGRGRHHGGGPPPWAGQGDDEEE